MQVRPRTLKKLQDQLHLFVTAKKKEDPNLLKIKTSDGYCYSDSLQRACFRVLNKLEWRKAFLDEIFSWDGKLASLKKKITLPDARESHSVKALFKYQLHYTLPNHAAKSSYSYARFLQFHFLLPGGPFLLLDDNDKKLVIESNYRMSGHLSTDIITKTLAEENTKKAIENNICLVHGEQITHTCELSVKGDAYGFFDPRYRDGEPKYFTHLKDLDTEMKKLLGNNLTIEIACFNRLKKNKRPFKYYQEILDKTPELLIENQGFSAFTRFGKNLIPRLIKNLIKRKKIDLLELNPVITRSKLLVTMLSYLDHETAIIALRKVSADLNKVSKNGWTPLMAAMNAAAKKGNIKVVNMLLAAGAHLNRVDPRGMTPLGYAAKFGHAKVLEWLHALGANPNQVQSRGWTPLMFAVENKRPRVIKALHKMGVEIDQAHPDGRSLLILAAQYGHAEIISLLWALGADPNKINPNKFDVNKTDLSGSTPLMIAAGKNHPPVIHLLYALGADINKANNVGMTAMGIAAFFGSLEAIRALCALGVDFDAADSNGMTPLMYAAENGHAKVLEWLHAQGADPNKLKPNGWNAFFLAVLKNHPRVVKTLHAIGVDIGQTHADGWTALLTAAQEGHTDMISLLLTLGDDPNKLHPNKFDVNHAAGPFAWTPMLSAAKNNHPRVIELLHTFGADPNKASSLGEPPILIAASNGHVKVIEVLCKIGANPNASSAVKGNWTALMHAAFKEHIPVMEALCAGGADLNQANVFAPIMVTPQKSQEKVIELILNHLTKLKVIKVNTSQLLAFAKNNMGRGPEVEAFIKAQYQGVIPNEILDFSALDLAIFFGHMGTTRLLLSNLTGLKISEFKKLNDLANACNHLDIMIFLQTRMKQFEQFSSLLSSHSFLNANNNIIPFEKGKYRFLLLAPKENDGLWHFGVFEEKKQIGGVLLPFKYVIDVIDLAKEGDMEKMINKLKSWGMSASQIADLIKKQEDHPFRFNCA